MSNAATIQDYLVGLGFKIDEDQLRKFNNAIGSAGKGIFDFSASSIEGLGKLGFYIGQTADKFTDLYYTAQRSQSSIQGMQAFGYAARLIGVDADTALQSIQNFQAGMRTQPGRAGLLAAYGIATGTPPLQEYHDLITKLINSGPIGSYGYALATHIGERFGIPESLLLAIKQNPGILEKAEADFVKSQQDAGLNPDDLGKKAVERDRALAKLLMDLGNVKDAMYAGLIDPSRVAIEFLDKLVLAFNKVDDSTKKFVGVFGPILGLTLSLAGARKAMQWFLGTGGKPPAAAPVAGGPAVVPAAGGGLMSRLMGRLGVAAWVYGNRDEVGLSESQRATLHRMMHDVPGGAAVPSALQWSATPGGAASVPEQEAYIRQAAIRKGIDPNVAVAVARTEGLGGRYAGDDNSSFGVYQLHYGGLSGAPGMGGAGLGDAFTRRTGLDARDQSTWRQQIDFALDQAAQAGWGPWHGAARAGIGEHAGIGSRFDVSDQSASPNQMTISPTTTIHVTGASDPDKTGQVIKYHVDRANQDIIRYFATVPQ